MLVRRNRNRRGAPLLCRPGVRAAAAARARVQNHRLAPRAHSTHCRLRSSSLLRRQSRPRLRADRVTARRGTKSTLLLPAHD
eukprot:4434077-Pleurochrysis_carterae.AAC.1